MTLCFFICQMGRQLQCWKWQVPETTGGTAKSVGPCHFLLSLLQEALCGHPGPAMLGAPADSGLTAPELRNWTQLSSACGIGEAVQ